MTTTREASVLVDAGRLTVWLVGGWLAARAVVDPDLWGHIRFGLDAITNGGLTSVDPYSFTQDVPWINHEWLSEVLFAAAYRAGGVAGLVLLKTAILGTTTVVLASLTREVNARVRWWLLAVALISLGPLSGTFRPQLWTVLGLALVCRVLAGGASPIWLAVVFPVWANLHGGWIVGAGLIAAWIVGRLADTRALRQVIPLGLALVVGVACTAINPYGPGLWTFLLTTVRMSRNISEWRPLWQQPDISHAVLWMMVASFVTASVVVRRRQIAWAGALPVAWLGVSSLFVDRLMPLFGEISLLLTAAAWRAASSSEPGDSRRPNTVVTASAPTSTGSPRWIIDAIAVSFIWVSGAVTAARCLPIQGSWAPDLAGAGLLASPGVRGRLVVPFDWGEYAVWHFGPRLRVSMDGRRETVYSDQTVRLQSAVARGAPEGLAYLASERPEYVWLPSGSGGAARDWLRANGYGVVDNGTSFVAARGDLPLLEAGAPMSRCFP